MNMLSAIVEDGVEMTPEIEEFAEAASFWLDVTNSFHEQALAHSARLELRAHDPLFHEYVFHTVAILPNWGGGDGYKSARQWYFDAAGGQRRSAMYYDLCFKEGLLWVTKEISGMAKKKKTVGGESQPVGGKAEWKTLCRSGGLVVRRSGGLSPTCSKSP